MLLGIGVIVCAILASVAAVRAMRDQRRKGKGSITSFIVGCFTGGFTGAFLLVMLGVASVFFIGGDSKIEEVEAAEPATAVGNGPEQFDDVIAMAEHLNDYPPEFDQFSVIESDPLHIQLLPSIFKNDAADVVHDTNWRAALYGVYNTFIHTDAERVIVDAIPREYTSMRDRNSPKLMPALKITLDMSRQEALETVQGLIDVSTLQGLKERHPEWGFYGWTDDWNSIYYSDQKPGLYAFIRALQPYCSNYCK